MCPWVCCLHLEDGSLLALLNRRRASDVRRRERTLASSKTHGWTHPGTGAACPAAGSRALQRQRQSENVRWGDLGREGRPEADPRWLEGERRGMVTVPRT